MERWKVPLPTFAFSTSKEASCMFWLFIKDGQSSLQQAVQFQAFMSTPLGRFAYKTDYWIFKPPKGRSRLCDSLHKKHASERPLDITVTFRRIYWTLYDNWIIWIDWNKILMQQCFIIILIPKWYLLTLLTCGIAFMNVTAMFNCTE